MKKLFLIGALSASFFIQANNDLTSKPEENNNIKIVKIENSRWYVICKDQQRYEFETPTDDFETALRVGNSICREIEKKLTSAE